MTQISSFSCLFLKCNLKFFCEYDFIVIPESDRIFFFTTTTFIQIADPISISNIFSTIPHELFCHKRGIAIFCDNIKSKSIQTRLFRQKIVI